MTNEWQEIKHAPKDGTMLLTYGECGMQVASWSRLDKIGYQTYGWRLTGGALFQEGYDLDNALWANPTHFKYLPEVPTL